jgi:predicted secreted protein
MYLLRLKSKGLLAIALLTGASILAPTVSAQDGAGKARRIKAPQATLQAGASAQIAQDTVRITLASEVSDVSQTVISDALSKAMDSVMKQAKADSRVKVSSGNFRIWPMNDQDGKISNWRGRGEIYLESTDFGAASKLAAALSDRMPISNLDFSVSPQARTQKEEALLSEAAQAFRDRAQALTTAFGFTDYSIREINLDGAGARYESAPRMMSMAADKVGVPLEGGTETVTVSIRGSIFLRSAQK